MKNQIPNMFLSLSTSHQSGQVGKNWRKRTFFYWYYTWNSDFDDPSLQAKYHYLLLCAPDFVGQATSWHYSPGSKMNPKRFGASHIRTVEEQSLPIITGCQDFFALGRNFNLSPLFRRRRRLFQKRRAASLTS